MVGYLCCRLAAARTRHELKEQTLALPLFSFQRTGCPPQGRTPQKGRTTILGQPPTSVKVANSPKTATPPARFPPARRARCMGLLDAAYFKEPGSAVRAARRPPPSVAGGER